MQFAFTLIPVSRLPACSRQHAEGRQEAGQQDRAAAQQQGRRWSAVGAGRQRRLVPGGVGGMWNQCFGRVSVLLSSLDRVTCKCAACGGVRLRSTSGEETGAAGGTGSISKHALAWPESLNNSRSSRANERRRWGRTLACLACCGGRSAARCGFAIPLIHRSARKGDYPPGDQQIRSSP